MHRRPHAYGTIVRSVFTAKRRSLVEGNECKRDLRTTEIIAKVDGHYHGITDHGFSLRNLRPFSRPAGLDLVQKKAFPDLADPGSGSIHVQISITTGLSNALVCPWFVSEAQSATNR